MMQAEVKNEDNSKDCEPTYIKGRLMIPDGMPKFKSILNKAPAEKLTENPRAYWNLLTIAESYSTGGIKD